MIIVKKPAELESMRISARKTATILHKVAAKVAPGVTTRELDDYALRKLGKRVYTLLPSGGCLEA